MGPSIELIVALSQNRVIGKDNQLPWHLPEDLKFFKRTTLGQPVLMGRKTYESIGKPLPGRLNIVISRTHQWSAPDLKTYGSVKDALAGLEGYERIMIIGGAQIFEQCLALASVLYLTEVQARVEGNVFFPEFDRNDWQEQWSESHAADERHAYPYRFVRLIRR